MHADKENLELRDQIEALHEKTQALKVLELHIRCSFFPPTVLTDLTPEQNGS